MENLDGIKNIIFDLGGVLLNIDFEKTFDAFEALGIKNSRGLHDRADVMKLFLELECGKVERTEFLRRFRDAGKLSSPSDKDRFGWISDEQIISAFNALLLDYPPERIRLVQELNKKYRVFLLSNTNAIHVEYYNSMLKREFGIENLDHLMEKAFYSNDLGCRKPDKEIYLKVLQQADIKAEETLFIDDNEENVRAAESLGIRAIKVDKKKTVIEVFSF